MRRNRVQKALRPALHSALIGNSVGLPASTPPAFTSVTDAGKSVAERTPATSATAAYSLVASCTASFDTIAVRTVRSARKVVPQHDVGIHTAMRWQTAPSTDAVEAKRRRGKKNTDDDGSVGDDGDAVSAAPAVAAGTEATSTTAAAKTKKPPSGQSPKKKANVAAVVATSSKAKPAAAFVKTLQKVMKPVPSQFKVATQRAYKAKMRIEVEKQASAKGDATIDAEHPWRSTAVDMIDSNTIAFSDSAAELFELDEEKHDVNGADEPPNEVSENRSDEDADEADTSASQDNEGGETSVFVPATNATDIDESLMDDPFHIPSVDEDALARDGGTTSGHASSSSAMGRLGSDVSANSPNHISESILASVDLLCDDLFHCKTEVLRSFAHSRQVKMRTKSEVVLQLVEQAHKAAHGESEDLSLTRSVLGDVFDDSVRTSGVRSAWTNKSLEASHVELACERHLKFQLMANSQKTMMVRNSVGEASRVLRKLTRIFLEEQENLSVVAVGGVFRNYRAEADELVRSLPITEIVSPFASFLVAYVRYASSMTTLTRENVNDHLVQLEVFHPTVQEMDGTATLQRLMDMLDPAVRVIELENSALDEGARSRFSFQHPQVLVANARAFSETPHTRWNTAAAPEWVHDLARLFCNWEAIVRTDLPRFEDVPRYFFDCILEGVVDYYVLQRVYGDLANPNDVPTWLRRAPKVALTEHLANEDNVQSAMNDLLAYVQAGSTETSTGVRGEFFVMVLSQMQGAFQGIQEERSALHDERVAVILRSVCATASHCTRSHGLFSLLIRITDDLRFHLRFQRVYKKLSGADRKTIRTKAGIKMIKTLEYFESEYHIPAISTKAVGFLVVQLLYLALRGDGSKPPVLQRIASVTGVSMLDVVGLTEMKAVDVRDLHIAFPPQLSYNSWLNESDTREKSVYSVLPSVAVKGTTNQAMIISQAPMMKALDAISRVPWRINKYMLHVQEAIVREGFGFGKIRPGFYPLHYYSLSDGSIHYPSERRRSFDGTAALDDDEADITSSSSSTPVFNIQQRRQMQIQQNADWKELSELRSSRIHYLQALRQARSILQFSHIYFPNSMDFRGRMYPLPGRLNHTGSDPFRGLLEYAEPKPLGSVGLYWLKVHLANKMGMSKLSFDERVHYVDEHLEDVVQSAECPLQGDRWWQEASEPLQCLMACKEVASAMKCSQGPENFLSRLPVAVDGSYNGLQHYSAIGRDAFGASLVNLIPSERPADAYTGILKEMLKSIDADAARDHQVAQRCLGSGKGQDKDHIKRKTIKRPIMTQVYGVTAFGMSEQIFDELQKQNKSHGLWTHTDMKEMAAYLRDKVLESLGVTFRETQNCRRWISDVVQLIWKVQPPELRNALCWTTPLGLVVRQPYKVRNECSLFTTNGYAKIAGDAIAPASRKQLTAVAPNLIHSLDATHLAMTALEMQHQGLSMMAVHDSYWTYACDLPKLSQVLREQFVNLYSKYDPLWELKEQWEETYFMDLRRHGVKLPEPPKRGTLDLNSVLKSPYFFS